MGLKGVGIVMFPMRMGLDFSVHVGVRGCARLDRAALPASYDGGAIGKASSYDMLWGGGGAVQNLVVWQFHRERWVRMVPYCWCFPWGRQNETGRFSFHQSI